MPHPVTRLPVVGMVGAGQLARMSQQAAIALGIGFRVLADTPDDSAAQVCGDVVVGDYRSYGDLAAFAAGCDVVTFDHEHVPLAHIAKLVADGAAVHPGPQALPAVQDKIAMRRQLDVLGVPVPAWSVVETVDQARAFADAHGWPLVAKTATGGYDGKGVWSVASADEVADLLAHTESAGLRLLVEPQVPFVRELAVQVARSASGETRSWPVVQTVQIDGICVQVLAPAPGLAAALATAARRLAVRVAEELDVVGVLALELFETADVEKPLLVNELAMRPHNSGHWSIEGARTSQFEQHLRAVLGWPLGDTSATAPYAVMANVLGGVGPLAADLEPRLRKVFGVDPGVRVHLYGKQVRPGRKIGHVTALGVDWADTRDRAVHAAALLRGDLL